MVDSWLSVLVDCSRSGVSWAPGLDRNACAKFSGFRFSIALRRQDVLYCELYDVVVDWSSFVYGREEKGSVGYLHNLARNAPACDVEGLQRIVGHDVQLTPSEAYPVLQGGHHVLVGESVEVVRQDDAGDKRGLGGKLGFNLGLAGDDDLNRLRFITLEIEQFPKEIELRTLQVLRLVDDENDGPAVGVDLEGVVPYLIYLRQ